MVDELRGVLDLYVHVERQDVQRQRGHRLSADGQHTGVGVAWLEAALDHTPEETVQLADQALYAAKLAGRNDVRYMGRGEIVNFDRTLRRLPRGDTGPMPAA